MRSLLILLVFLGNAVSVFAQEQAAKSYGEQLEAVHSAASAQLFMESLPSKLGTLNFAMRSTVDFSMDSLFASAQEHCFVYQIHSDSVADLADYDSCARYTIARPAVWVKADFDGDGRPDLLASSGYSHYAVMNRGAQLPEVIALDIRGNWRDCQSFTVVQRGGVARLEYLHISRRRHTHNGGLIEPQVWHEMLTYHLGSFVEYNAHPNPQLPQKVGLRYRSGGPPPTSGYDITINTRTGRVKRQLVRYKDAHPIKKLRYRLSTGALDTLRQQLAYLDIAGLQEEYDMAAFDASTVSLAFRYSHRPPKLLEDYGLKGTYGLCQLYDLLFDSYEQAEARQDRIMNDRQKVAR